MPEPVYTITVMQLLMLIGAAKGIITHIMPSHTMARPYVHHRSTMIEASHLTLEKIERWFTHHVVITEHLIQTFHTLMIGNGIINQKPGNLSEQEQLLRTLDARQRKVLELFKFHETITAAQVAQLFGLKARSASEWCRKWTETGFFEIVDFSKKARRYKLADKFAALVQ